MGATSVAEVSVLALFFASPGCAELVLLLVCGAGCPFWLSAEALARVGVGLDTGGWFVLYRKYQVPVTIKMTAVVSAGISIFLFFISLKRIPFLTCINYTIRRKVGS